MKYDWHQGEDHLGIYRVINEQLQVFESDFTQIPLMDDGDPEIHGDWALRVELLCNLLNARIISEVQAIAAMELMARTQQGASQACSEGVTG